MPDVSGLSITTVLTTVLNYWSWEQKIPNVSVFVTSAGFTMEIWEVEIKISDVSDLVKKTECDAKIR